MQTLDEWEERRKNALLARETPEWWEKRLEAEDPDTTTTALERLAGGVFSARAESREATLQSILLNEAVLAHPNVPPNLVFELLGPRALWAGALCRNPAAPLLCAEIPAFRGRAGQRASFALLREEILSPLVAEQLTHHTNPVVAEAATLHISITRELKTPEEGAIALSQFWRAFCENMNQKPHKKPRVWDAVYSHTGIAELGLAPAWAATKVRKLDENNIYESPQKFVETAWRSNATTFEQFVATQQSPFSWRGFWGMRSAEWGDRLSAALKLSLSTETFPNPRWDTLFEASSLDVLHHLAHDGNRFVRWAAQTRLADPDFVFTWAD